DEAATVLLDRRPIEIAEPPAEGDQVLVVERLPTEQEHGMEMPGVDDAFKGIRIEIAQIHSAHFRGERPAGGNHFELVRARTPRGLGLSDERHRLLPYPCLGAGLTQA